MKKNFPKTNDNEKQENKIENKCTIIIKKQERKSKNKKIKIKPKTVMENIDVLWSD